MSFAADLSPALPEPRPGSLTARPRRSMHLACFAGSASALKDGAEYSAGQRNIPRRLRSRPGPNRAIGIVLYWQRRLPTGSAAALAQAARLRTRAALLGQGAVACRAINRHSPDSGSLGAKIGPSGRL